MAKSSAAPAQKVEELKKLAESATQGDWIVREYTGGHIGVGVENATPAWKSDIFSPTVQYDGYGSGGASRADADFIAAANPKAILAILAAHQALYEALSAIAEALDVPRNRFGKLESDPAKNEELRKLAVLYKVGAAEDSADQAVKVARAALALADAAQGEK